ATSVLDVGRRGRDLARAGVRLGRLVRSLGAEVVHANGVKAALACALDPRLSRPPLVWVKHDFSWDGIVAAAVALRSRRVVAVSEAVAETFPGPLRRRVSVVHNGLPPIAADRPCGRRLVLEALGAPESAPVVALVGRLDRDKGHEELLAALPEVVRRRPGTRVAFIGADNPRRPEYVGGLREQLERDGLADAVSFLGYRKDAVELMSGCDVVVVPSVVGEGGRGREGFGYVGLEAFAVGTPVVAYADGALRETLGDCALLVPPGDREALGDAVVRVLEDDGLRSRLVECGRARLQGRFSLDEMVCRMKDEYRAAAKAH
ncbi:MAG TPA: glycosyltransferase family 4 protein, partial [Gaiellaceae bacterium]|nr:glycosyltransferase family 4 protein [Gaiellaceae bacterium]